MLCCVVCFACSTLKRHDCSLRRSTSQVRLSVKPVSQHSQVGEPTLEWTTRRQAMLCTGCNTNTQRLKYFVHSFPLGPKCGTRYHKHTSWLYWVDLSIEPECGSVTVPVLFSTALSTAQWKDQYFENSLVSVLRAATETCSGTGTVLAPDSDSDSDPGAGTREVNLHRLEVRHTELLRCLKSDPGRLSTTRWLHISTADSVRLAAVWSQTRWQEVGMQKALSSGAGS